MKPFSSSDISEGVQALEGSVSGAVTSKVARALSDDIKTVAGHLRAGRFEEAKTVVRELKFTDAMKDTEPDLVRFAKAAALIGAGAIDKPNTSIMASNAGFPFEVDTAAPRLLNNMIQHVLLRDTRRRLLERISRAERFQKADAIDPEKLANDINRFLRGEIRRVVDVSANLVGTRVSAYGMLYEARARGISKYRIDAVMDDRTTEICQHMNGRTFEVEFAFSKTATILNTTDPAALKQMAPFPELDNIRELSSEELQAQGHDTPPFHFLCRSVVTLIETQTERDPVPVFPDSAETLSSSEITKFFMGTASVVKSLFKLNKDEVDTLKNGGTNYAALERNPKYAAVREYTGGTYRRLNSALRRNETPDDDIRDTIWNMDRAFKLKDASLKEDQVVYRGLDQSVVDRMEIGKVFQDDGFVSTTINPGFASDWSGSLLQIYVSKGQKAIPVELFSKNQGEAEYVLARGTQFRVIGKGTITLNGKEREVTRVVVQGVGEKIRPSRLGKDGLTTPDSVVKITDREQDKFVYKLNDLKEASMRG